MRNVVKTTKCVAAAALFLIALIIAVAAVASVLVGCSDSSDSKADKGESETEKPKITDVFVLPETTDYDGQAHGVQIVGLRETDKIEYSHDGKNWQSEVITYTDAGVYTMYCRVERAQYETYITSVRIEINPKEITGVTAEDITVTEGETIQPKIIGTEDGDGIRYSIDNGEYTEEIESGIKSGSYIIKYEIIRNNHNKFNGQFILTVEEKRGLKVTVNGKEYRTDIPESKEITITVENENVKITTNGNAIAEITGYNYCEEISGVINTERDHAKNTVRAEIDKEEISITLSLRQEQQENRIERSYMYDGKAHGIEKENGSEILFGKTYTEVGEYETTVVVLKDGYLPKETTCVVRILPDMTGVYVGQKGVVEIVRDTAKINNKVVEYKSGMEQGTLDGKTVIYGQSEITFDGETYALTTEKYLAATVNGETTVIKRNGGSYTVRLTETKIILENDSGESIMEKQPSGASKVYLNGDEREPDADGEDLLCYITESEMWDTRIAWVVIE